MDLRGLSQNALAPVVLAAGFGLLLGACAYSGPSDTIKRITTTDYGDPYLGMSKAEVLSCAGQPRSRIPAGPSTETLVYHYSGAGPVPSSGGSEPSDDKKKKKSSSPFSRLSQSKSDSDCTASLTFEKDRLVRVSYAHKEVRSPYEWQSEEDPEEAERMKREGVPTCMFSLPRCRR
jgi:hypothetical protein